MNIVKKIKKKINYKTFMRKIIKNKNIVVHEKFVIPIIFLKFVLSK